MIKIYTENNKGFTIITNFGCDNNCKYCITKHHPILQNAVTDKSKIDWVYLEECISKSNAPTINLSGGGDPFYNWQNNIDFYVFGNKDDISRAIGKTNKTVVGIKDKNLAGAIQKILNGGDVIG